MTLRLLFNTLIICGYCNLSFSQVKDVSRGEMLSKQEAMEDYDILYSSLVNYHPAPYFYTSESEIRSFYEHQKAELNDSINEMEFVFVCKKLIAELRCGHTSALPSKDWFNSMKGLNNKVPFDLKIREGKFYFSNIVDDTFEFKLNDELLRVNKRSISEIVDELVAMETGDGYTQSFRNALVEKRIRTFLVFLLGIPNTFEIEYKNQKGEVKSVSVLPTKIQLDEFQDADIPENLKLITQNNWSTFHFDSISHLAYLKISSFGDKNEYKAYYKGVFKFLKKDPDALLILDLRNNPGGDFRHGNLFLTYVSREKFRLNFERPREKRLTNDYVKYNHWDKLVKFAFSIKFPKYKSAGQITESFTYRPKKNRFEGKLFVITNGITFSQAALVSSQLKANGATFFGKETGGAELGCNGILTYKLTLPNSKVQVDIPAYHVKSNSSSGTFGYGVKPDYPIELKAEDRTDNTLNKVLSIILTQLIK